MSTVGALGLVLTGHLSALGRVFLKRLLQFCPVSEPIYILQLSPSETQSRPKLIQNSYFSAIEQEQLKDRLIFIDDLCSLQKPARCLFNLFLPRDMWNLNKLLKSNILQTSKLCEIIRKSPEKVVKTIVVSSIFGNPPGYLSENVEPSRNIRPTFNDIKDIEQHLSDSQKGNSKAIWQWSINWLEGAYWQSCSQVDIVRVPHLGPTYANRQAYLSKVNDLIYLIRQIGSGFISAVYGRKDTVIDLLPIDYLANYMLTLGLKQSHQASHQTVTPVNRSTSKVHQLCTSSRNPLRLEQFINWLGQAWSQYEGKPYNLRIITVGWATEMHKYTQQFPKQLERRLATLLDSKASKISSVYGARQVETRSKLLARYEYLLSNSWVCMSNFSIDEFNSMTKDEQAKLPFNVNEVKWQQYLRMCCFSIKKHLLSQAQGEYVSQRPDMLKQENKSYFSDVLWALQQGSQAIAPTAIEMRDVVMNSKSVQAALKVLVQQHFTQLKQEPQSYVQVERNYQQLAKDMCTQMFSQYEMKSIRLFAWILQKIFHSVYQKVVLDPAELAFIKNYNPKVSGPLIVIPTHRSYIDFLIISYVFFGYGIKCPHIAAAEDFLQMAIVHILLRKSGAFFIRRNQKKYRALYKAVMTQYVTQLLKNGQFLQFFIEGTRSRVGKMLPPKFGMLGIVVQAVADAKIPDAVILPVTLNYQKVLEGASFTYEMMGETKVKETLGRLLRASETLKENFGCIFIRFCKHISVRAHLERKEKQLMNQGLTKQVLAKSQLQSLGIEITNQLSDNLMITGSAIVATVVLMHRKGISDDTLYQKAEWLRSELAQRSVRLAPSESNSTVAVGKTLELLKDIVTRSKKNMFEVQVSFDQESFVKLFTMTYLRNTLAHIFFDEAIVIVALTRFGHQAITKDGVQMKALLHQCEFLLALLEGQFYIRHPGPRIERINKALGYLQTRGVLTLKENRIVALEPDGTLFQLYYSIVWPIVESYWLTCLYLLKLAKGSQVTPLDQFVSEAQWFAQALVTQRVISHIEAICFDTIKNTVMALLRFGLLVKVDENKIKLNKTDEEVRRFQQKISLFLKSSYARSVKGTLESGHGLFALDYPFLSKL